MIEINLGNVGSGKTASVVRDMVLNSDGRQTFSNIITKKLANNTVINKGMIIKIEQEETSSGKIKEHKTLNAQFWKDMVKKYKSVNVIIDEAHTVFNARRGMTKSAVIMNDWLALLRRVLGSREEGYGRLVLLSQLDRRIDIIAREMATKVRWHICHYNKICKRCGAVHLENNETSDKVQFCMGCGGKRFTVTGHTIEVFEFKNMDDYDHFKTFSEETYFDHYIITDIEQYFPYYDTMQWDNLLSDEK